MKIVGRAAAVFVFGAAFTTMTMTTGCAGPRIPTVAQTYDANAVRDRPRTPICHHGEVVTVAVTNNTPPSSTVDAHSALKSYRFTRDPALVYQHAIDDELRAAGCELTGTPALAVRIDIAQLIARADGTGEVTMTVSLAEPNGKLLLRTAVGSDATRDCGALICSEEDASELTKQVITESVARTMLALADPMSKALGSH